MLGWVGTGIDQFVGFNEKGTMIIELSVLPYGLGLGLQKCLTYNHNF